MSQWKFNNFETDIDFTDVDFMEKFETAYDEMLKNNDKIPKVGKTTDIFKAQISVFDKFFRAVFGNESAEKMFLGKNSVGMRIEACNSLYDAYVQSENRYKSIIRKYAPNRQQRRHGKK